MDNYSNNNHTYSCCLPNIHDTQYILQSIFQFRPPKIGPNLANNTS